MRVLVRDLQPGQSYAIQFRAVTGTEASEWSQVMRLITSNDVLAPAQVTGLTASVVETSFKVRWDQVTTNTDGSDLKDFKDYEVHVIDRDSGADETYFVTETAFDFNFEKNAGAFGSAKPNLTFEVRARDVNYNAVAVPASVDISNDPPLAPTNFTVQPVVNAINFEWDGANNPDLKTYRVYKGSSAGSTTTKIYEGLSENFTYSTTDFGTNEYFRVAAVDVFEQETAVFSAVSGAPLSFDSSDITPPVAPTWPGSWFVSETDLSNRSAIRANVTLTWNANSESDLSAYIVQYKKTTDSVWSEVVISGTATVPPATSTKINGLAHNTAYDFRVAARDKTGNTSSFANAPAGGTTTTDSTPPTVPSTPAVSQSLGNLLVTWNGKNSTGGAMSTDTERVEVHASTTSNFVPSASTLKTVFSSAYSGKTQSSVISGLTYGTTYYFRLVAVDFTGNTSAASAQASGSPARLTGLDIQNGSLSTDQINFTSRDIGGARAFYQNTEPTDAESNEGDVWYNTANNYVIKYYNGTDWVDARDAGIQDALDRITTAEGDIVEVRTTADGKNKVYTTPTKPTGGTYKNGDIWFRESDNRIHVYNGTDFVDALDRAVTDAATAASDADAKAVQAQSDADAAATAANDANAAALEAAGIAEAKGEIFYGTSAPTGYKDITKVLWIDQTNGANTPKRWNGSAWVAITDKVATDAASTAAAANTAAGNAQQRADDAHALATTAQQTADGKNKITHSTGTPGSTPNKAGDIWFQRNASQVIIGQWEGLGGTSWSKKTIDNAVIANLDAGKITTGTLSADRIGANSITANKLLIGDTENWVPNPTFHPSGQQPVSDTAWRILPTNTAPVPTGCPFPYALEIKGRDHRPFRGTPRIPVKEGDKLYVSALVAADAAAVAPFNLYLYLSDDQVGGGVSAFTSHSQAVTTGWTRVEWVWTCDASRNGKFIEPFLQIDQNGIAGTIWYVTDWQVRRVNGSTLIADGAITTDKIATGSITAESGIIASLDASKITTGTISAEHVTVGAGTTFDPNYDPTGKATPQDVTDAVTPVNNQIDQWKFTGTTKIDGGEIQADSITAAQIAARSITAEELIISGEKNLIPNGAGETGDKSGVWAPMAQVSFEGTDKPAAVRGVFKCDAGASSKSPDMMFWDVSPGEEFYVEVWIKADLPNSRMYLELRDNDGLRPATRAVPGEPTASGGDYVIQSFTVPTTWNRYTCIVTASATANRMRMSTVYFNHASGTERNAVQSIAIRVRRRNGGSLIVDGSIHGSKITAGTITADLIGTNEIITSSANIANAVIDDAHITNVNASKIITGEIAVGQRIIAGPAAGTHAEMSDTGFRVYAEDSIDGIPNEVVRLGTDTNDYFAVTRANGSLAATISDTGEASFDGLTVANEITLGGRSLLELINERPKGVVARGWTDHAEFSVTTRYGVSDIGFPIEENRTYWIEVNGPVYLTENTSTEIIMELRYTSGDSVDTCPAPTINSTYLGTTLWENPGWSWRQHKYGVRFESGINGYARVLLTAARGVGSGWAKVRNRVEWTVHDIGPRVEGNSAAVNNGGGSPPPIARQYDTGNMAPDAWATYQGDNSQRFDTDGEIVQGYYSSINGDGKGYIRWNIPNITGTVDRVDLYLYSSHWYYNTGGTAVINISDQTGPTPAKQRTDWRVGGFPKPGGKWLTLPSDWRPYFNSRTAKTITLGPSNDISDQHYYGRFPWSSARLRIWYTQ